MKQWILLLLFQQAFKRRYLVMIIYEIKPFDWQYKLEQLSIGLENTMINVEVTGVNFGEQLENREMQLIKLSYDNDKDIIEIIFDQLNHVIESPLSICFQQHQNILETIDIFDDNDNKNIIEFIDPFLVSNYE